MGAIQATQAAPGNGSAAVNGDRGGSASGNGGAAITTVVDLIEAGEIDMVINIPRGRGARSDGYEIRRAAMRQGVPTMTNAAAAHAAVQAIAIDHKRRETSVVCLQDLHLRLAAAADAQRAPGGGQANPQKRPGEPEPRTREAV
jgi:hypothetical protein